MPESSTTVRRALALVVPLLAAAPPAVAHPGAVRPAAGSRTLPEPSAAVIRAVGRPSACGVATLRMRPPLYRIALKPAGSVSGAQGTAVLQPASTLFGVSVTVDGHDRFSVDIATRGLPAPTKLGAYGAYVAWAARADLSEFVKLGALDSSGRTSGEVSFQKFLVFVTAERSGDVSQQAGPIVLRGLSPSAQMKNMLTEPLLNGGMPPC